ncbi:hypothetical protein ASE61_14935 [Bosea sp. Root670]|uniref:DUF4031 domain-containing protein n=1 Tax=Bosea sp. Root670 TaxID=1736583 RepID=UPI000715A4DB|nr:DUF4031 domain-containing protein [Bosea sp. Root670]KRE02572.1 hypothetical protein ASE61_14935 [Bosea sp. Root670]
MTVYVDDVRHQLGRMVMCHMWADSLDELLAMADRIGVARKWIQGHPQLSFGKHRNASWVHFDIALAMKAKAIEAGAVLTDKFGPVEFEARANIATGDAVLFAIGTRKLRQVEHCRMQRRLAAETAQ